MREKYFESSPLELNHIVFLGRTWDEYLLMFNLSKDELIGRRILDCPGGACSFTATANKYGIKAFSVDSAYYNTPEELEKKGLQDIEYIISMLDKIKEKCKWNYFKSMDELRRERITALNQCIQDMKESKGYRYLPAILPVLPCKDKSFDMTLSAHLLFMYADQLDYNFHLQTIQEMIRVTRDEIRIFQTTDMNGNKYLYLDEIIDWLRTKGMKVDEVKVPYEFHRNANTMLRIICR
ncbi:hypothetical protein DNHGIG_32350 [Collibacillus ludicampi]|uniref:SAM-dependent methyltransferase n=1 Tax=Collibacillus ludicampi TaxID=2771369 RepID=A0AAV4LIV3_9BACL|nr:SAM-dependent methyltransferase [Collibacillus ludicampi]GIM47686.1 hypothetical protein DNHGIG_32350 [Collibacillus ludicampi]